MSAIPQTDKIRLLDECSSLLQQEIQDIHNGKFDGSLPTFLCNLHDFPSIRKCTTLLSSFVDLTPHVNEVGLSLKNTVSNHLKSLEQPPSAQPPHPSKPNATRQQQPGQTKTKRSDPVPKTPQQPPAKPSRQQQQTTASKKTEHPSVKQLSDSKPVQGKLQPSPVSVNDSDNGEESDEDPVETPKTRATRATRKKKPAPKQEQTPQPSTRTRGRSTRKAAQEAAAASTPTKKDADTRATRSAKKRAAAAPVPESTRPKRTRK